VLQGPIRVIDWHFRFRGRHIHKFCHFFLFESPDGEACPQRDEGITACQWRPLGEALEILSYDNARGVLKRAGEMVRTLVAVGAGRADRRTGGRADGETAGQPERRKERMADGRMDTATKVETEPEDVSEPSARPPVHPSA
jgi:hypothetical protein